MTRYSIQEFTCQSCWAPYLRQSNWTRFDVRDTTLSMPIDSYRGTPCSHCGHNQWALTTRILTEEELFLRKLEGTLGQLLVIPVPD